MLLLTIPYIANQGYLWTLLIGTIIFVLFLINGKGKQGVCPETEPKKRINYDEVEVHRSAGWYLCKRTEFSKESAYYYYNTSDRWEDPENEGAILVDSNFFLIGDKIR